MKRANNSDKPNAATKPVKISKTTATFTKINCPNCNDNRYESRGGFKDSGLYSQAMPRCIICDNRRTMIICYSCNNICVDNLENDNKCSDCHVELVCNHEWQSDGENFKCRFCFKQGTANPEITDCRHKFIIKNGIPICNHCSCKGQIELPF